MEKMATNKTHNKSPVLKMGQLWHTIDDNVTADEDETEEEEDVNKVNNETMKLRREDMSLFGICPAWDQFYLVVCEYCKQVIKPQALQQHIELRHSYHKHISNNQINNSLKPRTDSTNITTNIPSIRRTPSTTTTTATTITENGSDIKSSNDFKDKLVIKLPKSDVKLLLSSSDVRKSLDNNSLNNSVNNNCIESKQLSETNIKTNSKLINLLSPNISTTIEPSVPQPTGPGPGFVSIITSADINSITISVPEIDSIDNKLDNVLETEAPVVTKPAAKKKSYKKSANPRKLLPCKDREYDPNKHCGVCAPDVDKPCTRSLTCKTHSLTLRRSVKGRIKNFDELLTEHREAKEAALRAQGIEVKPTKKAIQRQQQQLRASQLQMKAEQQSQQSFPEKTNCQPMTRTLVFSDSQTIISNTNTNSNSNTNSLLNSVASPLCLSVESVTTREPQLQPQLQPQQPSPQIHHKLLDQIETGPNGTVHMWCHPKPAAVCNFNIRTYNRSRLLTRANDLTLAALRSTFSSPLFVLTNNQKCSSTTSVPKSPLRNTNQLFSPNKKLCTSIDSESIESSTDPYSFADVFTTNNNAFTYINPKTTIAKSPSNSAKKKKKSDINSTIDNSSLLSNGQLFHSININKNIGSNAKKKSVVKKNVNNSHNTTISATIPLTFSNNTINSTNCEQSMNPSTSLINEVPVPQRNLNDILSNSIDSCKSDNGSLLLNGSLLNCKTNVFTNLSKPANTGNIEIKDTINKKTFSANNYNNNNFLVNNVSSGLSSISSALSVNPNSRQLIQKQTLPSNTLSQSQNMSQLSQSLHNTTTHTIFIKSKQSVQNQLMTTITSTPKLLSKTEDYKT